MAHSFVFFGSYLATPDPYAAISQNEFVQFLTWHRVIDTMSDSVVGYVQFVFKRTAESLHLNCRELKFMQSVNDPAVYSHFLVPKVCFALPVTYGSPRPKTYVKECGLFVLKSLKEKAKKKAQAALTYVPNPKELVIKASLSLLAGHVQPL